MWGVGERKGKTFSRQFLFLYYTCISGSHLKEMHNLFLFF